MLQVACDLVVVSARNLKSRDHIFSLACLLEI